MRGCLDGCLDGRHAGNSSDVNLALEDAQVFPPSSREETENTYDTDDIDDTAETDYTDDKDRIDDTDTTWVVFLGNIGILLDSF